MRGRMQAEKMLHPICCDKTLVLVYTFVTLFYCFIKRIQFVKTKSSDKDLFSLKLRFINIVTFINRYIKYSLSLV